MATTNSEELKAAAQELSLAVGIPIDINVIERKPFDGSHALLYVVTLLIGALGKGVLSSVGGDLWRGLKSLTARTKSRDQENAVTKLVVDCDLEGRHLRYICQIENEDDVDRFAQSITLILSGSQPQFIIHSSKRTRIEMVLQGDGKWKENILG